MRPGRVSGTMERLFRAIGALFALGGELQGADRNPSDPSAQVTQAFGLLSS